MATYRGGSAIPSFRKLNLKGLRCPCSPHAHQPFAFSSPPEVPALGAPALAGDITVTHSSGATAINSLTTNEALTLSGGTLDVANTLQIGNTLSLAGGALANASVTTLNGSQFQATSNDGTLDNVTLGVNTTLLQGRR